MWLRIALSAIFLAGAGTAGGQDYCPWSAPTSGIVFDVLCAPGYWCTPGYTIEFRAEPGYPGFPPAPAGYRIEWCDIVTWSFGDGTTATHHGRNTAHHIYRHTGNYTLTVTIENERGRAEITRQIVVSDGPPAQIYFPRFYTPPEFQESNDKVSVPIALRVAVDRAVSIDYEVYGVEVQRTKGTIMFPPGATEAAIPIQLIDDELFSFDPRVYVNLKNPMGGTVTENVPWYVATVIGNEPPPRIRIDDVAVRETDGVVKIPIRVDPPMASLFGGEGVYCRVRPKTAKEGMDYLRRREPVGFPRGQSVIELEVEIIDDKLVEPLETFEVSCSFEFPYDSWLDGDRATVTIISDELMRRRAAGH